MKSHRALYHSKRSKFALLLSTTCAAISAAYLLAHYADPERRIVINLYSQIQPKMPEDDALYLLRGVKKGTVSQTEKRLGCHWFNFGDRFELMVVFDDNGQLKRKLLHEKCHRSWPDWLIRIGYKFGYFEVREWPKPT